MIGGLMKEVFRDRIIFLKSKSDFHQIVGVVHFHPEATTVRYKKKSYPVPAVPSCLNKYGKRTYFVEHGKSKQIFFKGDSGGGKLLTADEIDIILSRGFIGKIVKAMGVVNPMSNLGQTILALVAGAGIGFIGAAMFFLR